MKIAPLLAATLFACAGSAFAFSYDEAVNGDLSGDRLNPSTLLAMPGVNGVAMSSTTGDRDYFTFSVPAGHQLTSIFHVSYVSNDNLSFIGLQIGSTFTEPPNGANPANLLGYYHFGVQSAGTEIIDDLANSNLANPPAQGFTAPLGAGPYTFWVQQTGVAASYSLEFVLTPVPEAPTTALLGLGGLLTWVAARRRMR
jgi:hypothetical protein